MDIAGVREAIADAVRDGVTLPSGLQGLTATGYVPDAVTEPCFFVGEWSQEYDKSFRGLDEIEFTCRVLVGRGDDKSSQKLLDSLLSREGTASVKAAIEAARGAPGQSALGGLADDLHVTRVQGYRWYEHQGTDYVGAEIIIKVMG